MAQCRQQPADDGPFDIEALPDELLADVFCAAGLHASLKALTGQGGSGRLHRAWQSAVTSLTIERKELNEGDAATIAKYAKLERLNFDCLTHGPPAWHVLLLAAPSLTGLKSLSIKRCPDAFGALHVLGGCTGLQRSLEELDLRDDEHRLSERQLWGLQGLTRLSSLRLACEELQGSFDGAAGVLTREVCGLRHLDLTTARPPSPAQLGVFPGCMTQLTRLELQAPLPLDDVTDETERAQQQGLVAAISRLTNLQDLDTDYVLMAPEAQRQTLGRLQQLTTLRLQRDIDLARLVVVQQLSRLVVLDALYAIVCNPFPHPSLRELDASHIELQGPAAGQQPLAQQPPGCPLQELALMGWDCEDAAEDASLQHLPQLPALMKLLTWLKPGADGRFRHLAALLHRQAHTLQELRLELCEPFEEVLPRELPACRKLEITGISRHTLHALAACRLPALQELKVWFNYPVNGLDAELDLGWLRGLPALTRLHMLGSSEGDQQLREAVSALLLGSGVMIWWGWE